MKNVTMARRRKNGECSHCGVLTGGPWRCADCRADFAKAIRETRQARKAAGLCITCNSDMGERKGKRLCTLCRCKWLTYQKKSRAKKQAAKTVVAEPAKAAE